MNLNFFTHIFHSQGPAQFVTFRLCFLLVARGYPSEFTANSISPD
jgi:hypothetical protein